uniref:M-phase-specific PLK1-interacting protein-like n=1 Tax=Crassostrea virginica TaxID=6565 RepID=A0A8B8D4P4_CRAVI|nr:M-phase-specific PLK1-interacting protein-like [Crassostrea virginica]
MILKVKSKGYLNNFPDKMNNRGFHSSPRGYSPYNAANRSYGNVGNQPGHPMAWGTPAGSQPNFSHSSRRPPMSPRHQQYSPRHHNYNSSFTPPNYRMSSPKDHHFRTPNSDFNPFSPPNSGGSRGRGSGRNSQKTFQNPRKDKSCNPGGSQNIEDYYHPEMLQDPWKFCTPVSL